MSYQEKRIKSGLAVTAAHLKLCDDNLRRADTASRNEFVEKAIEFYAGYLNAAQNPHFFDGMFTSEAQKKSRDIEQDDGDGPVQNSRGAGQALPPAGRASRP